MRLPTRNRDNLRNFQFELNHVFNDSNGKAAFLKFLDYTGVKVKRRRV